MTGRQADIHATAIGACEPRTHKEPVALVSMIGETDQDILPHFLEHYRRVGVHVFNLVVHGNFREETLRQMEEAPDVVIKHREGAPYSEKLRRTIVSKILEELKNRWVFLVDADEFIELPGKTLDETIATLEGFGMDTLPAYMIQRVTGSGELAVLTPEDDIQRLFSHYNFNLCEQLGCPKPPWKTKFPLAKVTDAFLYGRGNHWPQNGKLHAHVPYRAILSHFKWRSALRDALKITRGVDAAQFEMDAYRDYLEHSNWRLPQTGANKFSRKALRQDGLLIAAPLQSAAVMKALSGVLAAANGEVQKSCADKLVKQLVDAASDKWSDETFDGKITGFRNLLTRPGRICFVTFELAGLTPSGGIATAVSSLMEILVAAGHKVEAVYCPNSPTDKLNELWEQYWKHRGVKVHYFPRFSNDGSFANQVVFARSLASYMSDQHYDVMHFDDASGHGGCVSQLKAAGMGFANTAIVTTTHGSCEWHYEGNAYPWQSFIAENTHGMREQLRLSDLVIHPSAYMQEWTNDRYDIGDQQVTIPNVLSGMTRSFQQRAPLKMFVDEIVFFGRLEFRKGLGTFFLALEKLASGCQKPFKVKMLGRIGTNAVLEEIEERVKAIGIDVEIITHFDSIDAVNYLKTNSCVAVIPSVQDNLPYTVYECAENGVPFFCSAVGGIPGMIDSRDRSRTLIASDVDKLAKALERAVQHGIRPSRLAIDPDLAAIRQLAAFSWLINTARTQDNKPIRAKSVSAVVFCDHGIAPIDGLLQQLSSWEESGQLEGTACLTSSSKHFTSAASEINAAMRKRRSTYILLCHGMIFPDRNDMLGAMLQLASAGSYDGVVCDYSVAIQTGSEEQHLNRSLRSIPAPAGPIEYSPCWNVYGANVALINRKAYLDAGGINPDCSSSHTVVWEVLNAMAAAGARIGSLPQCMVTQIYHSPNQLKHDENKLLLERLTAPWRSGLNGKHAKFIGKSADADFGKCPYTRQARQQLESNNRPNLTPWLVQPIFNALRQRLGGIFKRQIKTDTLEL